MGAWLSELPAAFAGIVVVGGGALVAVALLALFHRTGHRVLRRDQNELVGYTSTIVGTVYAVMLAFIAVLTWQSYSASDAIVAREANEVGNLYLDAAGLPEPLVGPVRDHIAHYLDLVTGTEWPAQQHGPAGLATWRAGWQELAELSRQLVTFSPANYGQSNTQAEMIHVLNELYKARRDRVLATQAHVPAVVWSIIMLGAAGNIGYVFLFGTANRRMHMVVTAWVAAMLLLVVLLIVELDYPFRGELSIGTDSYDAVRTNFIRLPATPVPSTPPATPPSSH